MTTVPKAKALKPWIDKMIDLVKTEKEEFIGKASVMTFKQDLVMPKLVGPLFWRYRHFSSPREWRSRYMTQPKEVNTGVKHPGYSRIHLYGHRDADAAPLAIIELTANPRDTVARLGMRYLPKLQKQLQDLRLGLYDHDSVEITDELKVQRLNVKQNLGKAQLNRLKSKEAGLERRIREFSEALASYSRAATAQSDYLKWAREQAGPDQAKRLEAVKQKLDVYNRVVGGTFSGQEIRQMRLFGLEIDTNGNILQELSSNPFYTPPEGVQEFDYWPVDPELLMGLEKLKIHSLS